LLKTFLSEFATDFFAFPTKLFVYIYKLGQPIRRVYTDYVTPLLRSFLS